MNWVNSTSPNTDIKNFTTDWNNGLRLSALVNYCKPSLISDHANLDPNDKLENITKAMNLAEKKLGVPQVMHPEDLAVDKPDELSVMTYVSGFCSLEGAGQNALIEWVNSKIPNQPVSNLTTDWADGRALAALVDALSEGMFPQAEQMKEEDGLKNCQETMEAAARQLGVKMIVTPEDFAENDMDHLTRSTYLNQFRFAQLPPTPPSLLSTMKAVGPGITGDSAEKETNFFLRGPRIPQWAKVNAIVKSSDGKEVPLKQQRTSSKAVQFQYTPEKPGDYTIEVTLNDKPVPGSTFNVTHVPPTNVDGCVATGSGLNKARVGETAGFSVNCKQGGPGELQVDVEGPNGNLDVEVDEAEEKLYSVSFAPKEAGDHSVSVLWDSKSIPSSPFTCVVTDPKKCTATGSGLNRGCLGDEMAFTVKTDKAGPGELSVDVQGPDGAVPAKIKDNGKGVYDVTYCPKDAGPHKIDIMWSDDPITGSPFSAKIATPAVASKCRVGKLPEGRLRANHTYSFDVDASDAGSGEMKASAQGPTVPESCSVNETGDGLYAVDFTPGEVGPLKVDVAYGDEAIPESPFTFTVNDPTKVKVNRAAIENGEYLAKQPIQFAVSAAHAGEGEVKATIRNPNGEDDINITEQSGKSYLLDYSPKDGGSHAINITFDGSDIPDVPIRIFVDDSNRADRVVVTQPTPGKIGAFIVDTPYEYKVIASDAGVDELSVTCVGAKTGLKPSVNVKKNGNGQYSAAVNADTPDQYTVNIQWGGEHVPGSPFTLTVEGVPRADKVVCDGPHFEVGSLDSVTLDADTANAGAGKLSATCIGDKAGTIPVDIAEREPKKYHVSFSPPCEDVFSLSILWQLDNVEDSPFKVNIISPDSLKCVVSGPEIPLKPSEPIVLYVDASRAGNGELKVSAIGDKMGEKEIDIKETEENKFVLSFVPELTDVYTWNVKWSDKDVPGAPFRVNSSGANADKVMICEPPTAMLEAGQPIGICFDTSKGGKGKLTATCDGKRIGGIPITVHQRSTDKNKFDVRFRPPEPDIFVVNVLWGGVDVKGSPFTINLMPVDVSKVKVIGPNMIQGPEGPIDLMLQTTGAGKGKVTGTCVGKKAGMVEVVIKETSPEVFELLFIPPKPDVYTFDVQYGGQTVKGSPFTINTLPPDASCVKVTEPDSIDISKPVVFNVDATQAGSGKLNSFCRGEASGPVHLDTSSDASGRYNVSFIPNKSDLYKMSMEWNGVEVPGSPFKVDLRPPMAGRVKVGDLHVPDKAGNGDYVWIDLDCSDAGHGPLKGEAKGKAVGKVPIEADRQARAKYRMKFLPTKPDVYNFAVAYGDNQVVGSPFKINLATPDASKVMHTRTTLPEFEGGPVAMYFDTSEAGNGDMTADIKGDTTSSVTKKVEELSPDEYKVTFIPDVPDLYTANIRWNDKPVSGSPFKVDTRPPLHPELVECGKPVFTDVGSPVNLAVDTRKAGPGKVTAKCCDGDKNEIPVVVQKPTSINDQYDISFTPKQHGNYDLSVFFEGEEVNGSPFPVNLNLVLERDTMVLMEPVESGLFIPEDFLTQESVETRPEEAAPSELTMYIGDPLRMSITAEDEDQRNGKLMARARGAETGPTDAEVTKNSDGTFSLFFNPTVPDHYTIDVSLNNEPVPNSPFVINYLNPIDPAKCRVFGLQNIPPVPQVNEPIEFGVSTKDAGDAKLSVTSDGPSLESVSSKLTVKESDKEPGIYNITYLPTATGEHRAHLLWGGEKIPGAPLVFKVGDIHKIQRYPYGKPVTININADANKASDFDAYAIQEQTGAKMKVKVTKEKKGAFKLGFQPKQPGIYAVHVLMKKKETPGSPYRIRYLGPPNPAGVVVKDFTGKGYVGVPIEFSINAEEAGTGDLGVRVEGPKDIKDSDITYNRCPDSRELSYNVSYTPRNPGDHNFHISWDRTPIPSSPLKADVKDLKAEYKTALLGEGTNIVEVGSPARVSILNGGPNLNLDTINAQCDGNESPSVDVSVRKDEGEDDKYVVQFVPVAADDYILKVRVNDEEITGSPFEIKAIEKERLSLDYAYPQGAQQSDVDAGKPVNLICSAPGIVDPADVSVTVDGPYGTCPPSVVSDCDGIVGVRFLPPLSGEYKVQADDLPCCPCKVRAAGKDPDAAKVSVLDKDMAVFESPIPFGKPARFRISTIDAGPGILNITSKGPGKAKVKVLDNKDGTYTCDFKPTMAGKYHIDILWNDQHINGSPHLLIFKSKKNRVIAGLNLENENFRIDVPHRFKLHCGEVGEGILEISTKPPSAGTVRLAPIPGKNNSYQCEILPKEVGNHSVQVQYNGKHIFGSPFNVQFDSCGDASKCRMVESTISGEDANQERVNFVISTEGAGTGKLTSSIEQTSTEAQIPVTVTPQPDNSNLFRVEFLPEEDVEYLLTIMYDNEHIVGSPFKLMFGGDAADALQCTAQGEGIQACILDREAKFVVNTLKPNQGELSVTIKGEKNLTPRMSPLGTTQTEVTYVADSIGKYGISVKWANEEIANGPFSVMCYGPSDPGLWTVDSPPAEQLLGTPVSFTVKATAGEPGTGTLTTTAQSANNKSIPGRVEMAEDRFSYTCTFDNIPDAGKYLIHVRWNGNHIQNSPFKFKVQTPPSPEKVKAYGVGLLDSNIGQEGNFTVETGDGGAGTLAVRVHGPKGAFKINMRRHPDNDRTILVRYDPTHIGKYTVDITWSEAHVPGSPFEVNFSEQ